MQNKNKKVRLKGNESFNFREGWLRKGIRCINEYPLLFSRDDVTITMENNQVTYQEGDEVSFTVTAKEKYAIRTASAFVALTGDEAVENTDQESIASQTASEEASKNAEDADELSPVVITPEAVEVSRTNAVTEGNEVVEASFEFEMPAEDVVLMASVALAASASNDVTVDLENGGIRRDALHKQK